MSNQCGKPKDEEYNALGEQLGLTRRQVQRIGKYEARRLLSMDESSRKLVLSKVSRRANQAVVRPSPKKVKSDVDFMMAVATRRKA